MGMGRYGVTLWALRDKNQRYGNDIGGYSPRFPFPGCKICISRDVL